MKKRLKNKSFKSLFAVSPAGKIPGSLKPGASGVFAKTQMIHSEGFFKGFGALVMEKEPCL
jgi:hypothetical protein